ncbi:uncharacterized protein LOC116146570 [Pistacia vera]|uniref:uncharacterized protein LOC116142269 n=1 Tax=Pistacia vera TaxID=55513 RepID=UPI001263873F|nr:uncharacterized protein LOC116142269 [Pistacia vera]XP_031287852.1 uncharacterized protein LOC116146570 [Pistacia vera]
MAYSSVASSLNSFLLLSALLYATIVSCSGSEISYSDHCASVVPELTPNDPEFTTLPFPTGQYGYYEGGDKILNPNPSQYSSSERKTMSFQTEDVYSTGHPGVFKVDGSLIFNSWNLNLRAPGMIYSQSVFRTMSSGQGALSFSLKGFWSNSSGKLCMVGSSSSFSPEGNILHRTAVLKLNGVRNSSDITSLVSGTLQSLSSADDSSYFEPISLLIFPEVNYKYTKASKDLIENEFSGEKNVAEANSSLRLQVSTTVCSIFERAYTTFELEYESDCNSTKTCNPFGDGVGYLPRVMSLNKLQCSADGRNLRFLVEFSNSSYSGYYYYSPFDPNTTFVGEGTWDWKKNRLCVVACRILNTNGALEDSHVEDCSIRLTLRFPTIWSIRNRTAMLGQIWSQKTENGVGYFDRILFRSTEDGWLRLPGLKYMYTAIEKVKNISCLTKKLPIRNGGEKYPDGYSYEMSFDMSVRNSRQEIGWGSSFQISIGDQISQSSEYSSKPFSSSRPVSSGVEGNTSITRPLNISYKISLSPYYYARLDRVKTLFNTSLSEKYGRVEIFVEGLYDPETGCLRMVGCRYLALSNQKLTNDSMDCEVLVHLQFPPLNAKKDGVYIRGTITSARNKSDPLYFKPLYVTSTASYTFLERQSIWRMDLEILMALVSNTLACVFVVFQLLYVKRNPGVLPFISLLMLTILTLGHMIVLVLNFEALFLRTRNRQSVFLGSGGWLEVHEVIVRIITMVAFLLQFRLLQLSLSKRMGDNNHKALWAAEKKALFVSLPLYLAGGLITFYASWRNNNVGFATRYYYSSRFDDNQHSLWRDLRSYAGFILDGFLFPQILLNMFYNSRENVLSRLFYIGFTFVRLVPHAYDLYRAQNYVQNFDGSYIYADHAADFYSTAWDVTIPLVGILFAAIIYLQRRFGGRCFFPRRFRELEVIYEKVPEASEE